MENSIIKLGKITFWSSFIAGNVCLFGFLFSKNIDFAFAGFMLLYIAAFINIVMIIGLLVYGYFQKSEIPNCLKAILIMLINIPIAILYAWIGLQIT